MTKTVEYVAEQIKKIKAERKPDDQREEIGELFNK